MRQTIAILTVVLGAVLSVKAQTPLAQMNEIKMSNEYLWDEFTHADADSATAGAIQRLLPHLERPQHRALQADDVKTSVKFIKIKRASLYRTFAYIKKEEVTAIVDKVNKETKEEAVAKEEKKDEALTEKKSETKTVKKTEKKGKKKGKGKDVEKTETKGEAELTTDQRVIQIGDFYDVYKYLEDSKKEGRIEAFGSLKDASDLATCHLVIFSKETRKATCVLATSINGETRRNLTTGELDCLGNYENGEYIAIWYKEELKTEGLKIED